MKNIALLSVDALRADHLACYGYERNTSPFLDQFGEKNAYFELPYSASSNTREAVPSLITGRYPDEAIGTDYRVNARSIASELSENGYSTAAFHSNPYASRAFGTDAGFDVYDDDLHLGENKLFALAQRAFDKVRNKHYVRAEGINNRSLDWLDSRDEDKPFFLWNHYMDVHGPYEPVPHFKEMFEDRSISDRKAQQLYLKAVRNPDSISDSEQEFLLNLYDGEIRYTDYFLKKFMAELEQRGLFDETLIIITADHGDAFNEHGYYEHPRHLHDEVIYVPLLMKSPGLDAADYTETPVSTLDIAPTIFEHAGISDPMTGEEIPGRSLFSLIEDPPEHRTVFSQARGEKSETHLRRFAARNGETAAFGEWDSETDGIDITDSGSRELTQQLRDHIEQRVGRAGVEGETTEVEDEEIDRRLSALGYKE